MAGSLSLYSDAFGFRNAGANCVWGDVIRSQGLDPSARALMWWMTGCQTFFQLEFFHHTSPRQRPLRADWKPNDHGWVRFGIAIQDIERSRSILAQHGAVILGETSTGTANHRYAFRDPYLGVIVEVMQQAPDTSPAAVQPGRSPMVVYVASSVSNVETARAFYRDTLGFSIEPMETLHQPRDEALWGLGGAARDGFVVRAGTSSVLLEIVQYQNPTGRPRPADHRVSDQGIMNVALGARDCSEVSAVFRKLAQAGLRPPLLVETTDIVFGYINDPERELEVAAFPESLDVDVGFKPQRPFMNRLIHSSEATAPNFEHRGRNQCF